MDADENELEIAQNKIKKEKLEIFLQKYNGSRLPYRDHALDKVVSTLVFHHLPHE